MAVNKPIKFHLVYKKTPFHSKTSQETKLHLLTQIAMLLSEETISFHVLLFLCPKRTEQFTHLGISIISEQSFAFSNLS